jgi:hypothetical protein
VVQGSTCFTDWMGVICLCTYKSLSKGRAFLREGKGIDALRYISRRILAPPMVPAPGSTSDLSA